MIATEAPVGASPVNFPLKGQENEHRLPLASASEKTGTSISRSERCRQLALAGEQKCKRGDLVGGVEDLEAALKTGTQNLHLMSTIYSQLGNAYFYLHDLKKAVECHRRDLSLSRILDDAAGEMKACSNLSSVSRQLEQFEEAISFARKRVELCRQLADKEEEADAMYVLANHHHALAKSIWTKADSSPTTVTEQLQAAVNHYENCLALVERVGGKEKLRGRVFGHLGNISYLLGRTEDAVKYHTVRQQLAQEQNDKAAITRAYNNIGNAFLLSQNFSKAESSYLQMLNLSEEVKDQASVAKALFGLATVYNHQRDHLQACASYKQQLEIVRALKDDVGELQALFGLSTTYRTIGEFQESYLYAYQHQAVAEKVNDKAAMQAAEMNVSALRMLIARDKSLVPTIEHGEQAARPLVPIEPPDSQRVDLTFSESGLPHIHPINPRHDSVRLSVPSADTDGVAEGSSSRRRSQERPLSRRPSSGSRSVSPLSSFRRARADSRRSSNNSLNSSTSSPRLARKDMQNVSHLITSSPLDIYHGSRGSLDSAADDNALNDDHVFSVLNIMQGSRLDDQRGVVGPKRPPSPRSPAKNARRSANLHRSFRLFSGRGSPHRKDLASGTSLSLPRSMTMSHSDHDDPLGRDEDASNSDGDDDINDLLDCLELVQGRSINDQRASLPTHSSTSSSDSSKRQTVV